MRKPSLNLARLSPGTTPLAPELMLDAPLVLLVSVSLQPSFKRDDYSGIHFKAAKLSSRFAGAFVHTAYRRTRALRKHRQQTRTYKRCGRTYWLIRRHVRCFYTRARNWRHLGATWVDTNGVAAIPAELGAGDGHLRRSLKIICWLTWQASISYQESAANQTLIPTARSFQSEINRVMSSNVVGILAPILFSDQQYIE
jgi:hypothetical protein